MLASSFFTLGVLKINEPSYSTVRYTVKAGDSYQKIAQTLNIGEDWRIWSERVKLLNGKKNSTLYAGEVIFVAVDKRK